LTGVFPSVHRQKTWEYRRIPCVFFLARAKIRSVKTAQHLRARDFVMIFAADNDGICQYSEADNAKSTQNIRPQACAFVSFMVYCLQVNKRLHKGGL
jgi:hypothetical protein